MKFVLPALALPLLVALLSMTGCSHTLVNNRETFSPPKGQGEWTARHMEAEEGLEPGSTFIKKTPTPEKQ